MATTPTQGAGTPAKKQVPVKQQAPVKAAEPSKATKRAATERNAPSGKGREGYGTPLEGVYKVPDGYRMRWAHGSYDLLVLVDPVHAKVPDGIPQGAKWIVTCNLHGTMTHAANAKEGDKKGSREGRPEWCPGCRAAAPAKAPAAKAAAPVKTAAPKPAPPAKKAAPAKKSA